MGTAIDDIIDEKKRGYAPLEPLVPLYKVTGDERRIIPVGFNEAKPRVISHAEDLIKYIENKAKTPKAKFTIGKSYARQMKHRNFDPTNFDTWIKGGIIDRWKKTYEKEGYNGLVVLCGITRELLPLDPNKRTKRHSLQDQQQYALALEQQLIHHFLFEAQDSRLGNDSLDKGKLAQSPYAGVVYLAFKLYTVREVWQLFQDAFELKVKPDDTVFVINMSNGQPDEDETKIIGGPRAENAVIELMENERFRDDLRGIRIFVNYIPSIEFVKKLVRPINQEPSYCEQDVNWDIKDRLRLNVPYIQGPVLNEDQDIILTRDFETEVFEFLSNNGLAFGEFEENDWNDLAKTLQLHIDGISPQRAIELEEFKTYLEKPKEEILEMFQEAMNETEKQKQEKAEPNDSVFVIKHVSGEVRVINGRNVENRVIHFLKDPNNYGKWETDMYVNYSPSKRFEKLLIKTVKEGEYPKHAKVLVGSEDEINKEFTVGQGKVEIKTMTKSDFETLFHL